MNWKCMLSIQPRVRTNNTRQCLKVKLYFHMKNKKKMKMFKIYSKFYSIFMLYGNTIILNSTKTSYFTINRDEYLTLVKIFFCVIYYTKDIYLIIKSSVARLAGKLSSLIWLSLTWDQIHDALLWCKAIAGKWKIDTDHEGYDRRSKTIIRIVIFWESKCFI